MGIWDNVAKGLQIGSLGPEQYNKNQKVLDTQKQDFIDEEKLGQMIQLRNPDIDITKLQLTPGKKIPLAHVKEFLDAIPAPKVVDPAAQMFADVKKGNLEQRQKEDLGGIYDKFNKDAVVQKSNTSIAAAEQVLDLVASGNPIAANAIPTYMARASGEVGNLSEADKAPFGGSQAILNRLEQVYQSATTGQLTPDNQKFLNSLSGIMKASALGNKRKRGEEFTNSYSQAGFGDTAKIKALLSLDLGQNQPLPRPSQSGDLSTMSDEDLIRGIMGK